MYKSRHHDFLTRRNRLDVKNKLAAVFKIFFNKINAPLLVG
jgi:hypothetical protein